MRILAAALFLVVFVAACGRSLPASSPNPGPLNGPSSPNPALDGAPGTPFGLPLTFGWDGVDGRMMMSSLVEETGQVDPSTWTFNGTEWVKALTGIPEMGPGTLIYDSGRNREVLVGPASTWEWDGQKWRQVSRSIGRGGGMYRPQRSGAYNPEIKATVVIQVDYGFETPPTWLWDGTNWRSVTTTNPPPRGPLAYDARRHSIIGLSLQDYSTWRFDGHDWYAIPQSGGASPVVVGMGRMGSAVAFDQRRGQWVVFSGSDANTELGDTWTGDGTRWTKRSPTTSPLGRVGLDWISYMAWDPSRGRLILFGGRVGVTGVNATYFPSLADTWAWDGSQWAHLAGSTYPVASTSRLTSP